ncbi:O-methyltransferase [Homoserinibacter sp. GY 40078]|uniref:O-methyltransferase n=1 Tax=Homoserinibacter sp. GY 40078 TaxID=2603275 RepID=UPI0011CB9257|nr:class I SAM-dependent methyltransferase [Homoserinibacter sp. GY 40078]TXK19605.1 methyltransferase domain-containing protein [Homoserinibacter sp. GY 40078]
MAKQDLSWKFAEEFPVEPPATQLARQHALELGADPISPAVGAQLAVLAAALDAKNILEIGTGAGVSGLWLLQGAPSATLTTIDVELDHQNRARQSFQEAGLAPARTRLIAGRATEVLPRMNDGAYDLVLVDADSTSVLDYVEHGLRIARIGGVVAVAHALWRGRVADPAQRDETVADFRALLTTISESTAVTASLSTAGDGLLQLVRTGD